MTSRRIVTLLFLMIMTLGLLTVYSETRELKLFINGERVKVNKELGYPFIDHNDRTQIPFRAFSEAFGAEVMWEPQRQVGYAVKDNTVIAVPMGEHYIIKNGYKIDSDTENIMINDRIYIPLRIVLEAFDCSVQWNDEEWAIYVESDSSKLPSPEQIDISKEGLRGVEMGDFVSKLTSTLGQPNRVDDSEYDFVWYIYNSDYSNYVQVGVRNNQVVAFYTNAAYWQLTNSVKYGVSTTALKQTFETRSGSSSQLYATSQNIEYTFFVDSLDNNKVTSVLMIDANVSNSSYYGNGGVELGVSFEKDIFDLTNVERVNRGLEPLIWKEDVATVARLHSQDMSDNIYFSHRNLQGEAPWERATDAGIKYSYYGENIAMGYKNAIYVVSGWMNSSGHRNNMLNENYSGLGVGVWFTENNVPYYTQNFISN
ncbi:stalk domain-containing protein [Vallitalea okinawensis]|uniref:stalk domain-containing protein n=1 Tax=Vallitalea okinawensis TaxID=2078660 RepID=UPI00147825E8|nr:CAP-associated domain-containing protein [Vallitalea okinawensis]